MEVHQCLGMGGAGRVTRKGDMKTTTQNLVGASKPIYGTAHVADALGVSRATVSNWLRRYEGLPPADFVTTDGRFFWLSLDGWVQWQELRISAVRDKTVSKLERLKARIAQLEKGKL